jgi:hypothetical protein
MSLGLAFKCFFKALGNREFAGKARDWLRGAPPAVLPPPTPAAPPKNPHEALRLLAALQRDGRLIDFLQEEIAGYDDAQVGAAVRDIHRDCRKALAKYVELAPVLDQGEGEAVAVPAGFDAGAIRLTGNVRGEPPFRGALAHRGWKAVKLNLPAEIGPNGVLAPAEVELP